MNWHLHISVNRFSAVRSVFSSFVYSFLVGTGLVAIFLLVLPVSAQTEETNQNGDASMGSIIEFEINEEESSLSETSSDEPEIGDPPVQEVSDEAVTDETVTDEELEVDDARILQDNPLYGLKRFGRGLRKAFTFNKKKKVDLEIRYANQELADVKKLVETKGEREEIFEKVAEAFERFEEGLGRAKDTSGEITEGSENAALVVEEIIDNQIKQQKLLEQVEKRILDKAPEEDAIRVVEKIQDTKEKIAAHAASTVGTIEADSERLTDYIDRALQKQRGSEFRELRNLEILKRVEDHIPEQARVGIHKAQENALKRFVEHTGQIPEEDRTRRFEGYLRHIGGDETRHLEILDQMKQYDELPEDLRKKIETSKDIMANKFKEKVERFETEFRDEVVRARFRERAFARFQTAESIDPSEQSVDDGSFPVGPPPEEMIGRLRVLDDIRQRVEFDHEEIQREFESREKESIEQFKNTFTDDESQDQVEQFERLSKKMAENPDPATFRILQELEQKVKADPRKREFIERIEREAKSQFIQKAQEKGDKFFEQVISSNPQDIEIFKELQEEFARNPETFFTSPGIGPDGFGPPPFGPDGEFLPPGVGPEGFGPPPFGPEGFSLPPGFAEVFEQVIDRQTDGLAEHVREIDDPELFESFQRKFQQQGSDGVVEELRSQNSRFEEVFRDKFRMINEQALRRDVTEDRQRARIEGERRQVEAEFERRALEAADDPQALRALEEEKIRREAQLEERNLKLQRESFEKRLRLDPFCDERCREEEKRHFERFLGDKQKFMREMMEQSTNDVPGDFDREDFGPPADFGPGTEPGRLPPDDTDRPISDYRIDGTLRERDLPRDSRIDSRETPQRFEPRQSQGRVIDEIDVSRAISDKQVSESLEREQEEMNRRLQEEQYRFDFRDEFERDDRRSNEVEHFPENPEGIEADRRKEQLNFNQPVNRRYIPDNSGGVNPTFPDTATPPQFPSDIHHPEPPSDFSDRPPTDFNTPTGFPASPDGQNFVPPSGFQPPPGEFNFTPPTEFR